MPRQDGNTESEALLVFVFLTVVWLRGSVHIIEFIELCMGVSVCIHEHTYTHNIMCVSEQDKQKVASDRYGELTCPL